MKKAAFLRSLLKFLKVYRSLIIQDRENRPNHSSELTPLLTDFDQLITRAKIVQRHVYDPVPVSSE